MNGYFLFLLTLYFGNVCLMLDLTEGAAYKWQMNLARLVHLVEESHKRHHLLEVHFGGVALMMNEIDRMCQI